MRLPYQPRCSSASSWRCLQGISGQTAKTFHQLELDNAAFVIDRASRTIFNSLRHIVNVNIVAEHFSSVAVITTDGRSRKADKAGVRKTVANDSRSALDPMRNQIALVIFCRLNFFRQAILTTVRFIRNHDDIAAVRKRS